MGGVGGGCGVGGGAGGGGGVGGGAGGVGGVGGGAANFWVAVGVGGGGGVGGGCGGGGGVGGGVGPCDGRAIRPHRARARMIALKQPSRSALAIAIAADGVSATRQRLGVDEQTMMRAALGVPLRDDVAHRIDAEVSKWEVEK